MRAFWWFKDNSVAGMGRPGFNAIHWYDLPFDEALLMGWIGQHSSGSLNLASLREHLRTYAPKIFKFYKLDDESGARAIQPLSDAAAVMDILERFSKRSGSFKSFELDGEELRFEMSAEQLAREITFLKTHGIRRIVSLTERHHDREHLQDHFELSHIGIEDLGAPQIQQAQTLANLLQESSARGERVAVHCLAGIGRTSTMLVAAHFLMGQKLEDLRTQIAERNPSFGFGGSQGAFLNSLRRQ